MKEKMFARISGTLWESNNWFSDPLCPYICLYHCSVILLSLPVKTLNCSYVCIFFHTIKTELLRQWVPKKKKKNSTKQQKSERRNILFFPALGVRYWNSLLKHLRYLKINWTEHSKAQYVFTFHIGSGINLII